MSKDKELSYEEQVEKEFNMTQEEQPQNIVKDLGRVDINRSESREDFMNDEGIRRINQTIGYLSVPLDMLPSQGKFYPEDISISIRAARVNEIREFSTIDETNYKDVLDKLTYIVSQCVKVYYGNTPGHYKDLTVADRIVLIIKVRELTFVGGQTAIQIPVPDGACQTIGCKPQDYIYFDSTKFEFMEPAKELEKYYDPVHRCYNINTKSFGTITLYIPTIGVNVAVTDFVQRKLEKRERIESTLSEMAQFLIKDWRGLTDRSIFATITEMSGWDTNKFNLVYRLIEKLNESVGIKFDIKETCETCGGEITVPISFPGGYKSIFVQTISDFGGELL